MANNTNNTNNVNGTNEQQGNVPVVDQQQMPVNNPAPVQQMPQNVQPVQPVQVVEQKGWFSRNWKKVLGIGTAVLTAVGTGAAAYKKGKAAGQMMQQYPPQTDYNPLDPNV